MHHALGESLPGREAEGPLRFAVEQPPADAADCERQREQAQRHMGAQQRGFADGIGTMILSGAGAILFFGAPGPLPDFWHFPPMTAHYLGAIALLALAGLHILAALYHQFYKRDRLLARMGVGSP